MPADDDTYDVDARAFAVARELIEEHGDEVGAFLEAKLAELREARDLDQFSAWFVIRNAVAITLTSGHTKH